MLPAYSVAVPVRNEINTLTDVVAAYVCQDVAPTEILICVNGSTDGTLDLARRLETEHPRLVRVLESSTGERKPGAWRAAFSAAANDLVLFGDGDTLPAPQNGRVLVEAIGRNSRIAAVASPICIVRPERPRSAFDWFSPDPFGIRPGTPNLQGAQYLIHRRRWQGVVAELAIPLMPDVVSEDGYIGRAISVSARYVVANEVRAEAYIQPIGSLREYNLAFCRLGQAALQFDAFPPLRVTAHPPGPKVARCVFAGILKGVRERDLLSITKALGTAWYSLSWLSLIKFGNQLERVTPAPDQPSQDDLWSLRTAKASFSRSFVASVRGD
jgi:glycosyltransferase involved in cell wall biosynthesis